MRRNYFALNQFNVKEQWALYQYHRRISTGKGFRKINNNGKRTMGKIDFTVTSPRNLLTEEDVYDVIPVAELSSRLKDECSLTLAFHGEFASGGYMWGTFDNLRGTWIAPDGKKKEDRGANFKSF